MQVENISFNDWIEKTSENKLYPYLLALLLVSVSLLLTTPLFEHFNSDSIEWQTTIIKSQDITSTLGNLDPGSQSAKRVFRLTVPIIMKLTHITPLGILILQYILGYLILVFSYKLTRDLLNNSFLATIITIGIVFTYFGRASFNNLIYMTFEGFSFFFVIMALYSRNIFSVFTFSTLAAWTDERAFIALSIVFFYHHFKNNFFDRNNFRESILPNKLSFTVLLAMVAYLLIRLFLSLNFNMHTPTNGSELIVLKRTLKYFPMGLWSFLEGFWLFYIFSFFYSIKKRNYLLLLSLFFILTIMFIIPFSVFDISRSGSYFFPVVFILIAYLKETMTKEKLQFLIVVCTIVTFIFPAFDVEEGYEKYVLYSIFVDSFNHVIDFLIHNKII